MKDEVSKKEVIGNELVFPVHGKKPRGVRLNAGQLVIRFLLGYMVIGAMVMGIRLSFYVNAGYAKGVVSEIKITKGPTFNPMVKFTTKQNSEIIFTGASNLGLKKGESVRVIYKNANPQRAVVYSFFGFWFNAIIICQVMVLFWVALLVVYYGDYS